MQLIRLCDSKNSLYGRNSFLVFAYFFEEHSWPLNWFKTETCILWTCLPAQNHSTCTSEWGGGHLHPRYWRKEANDRASSVLSIIMMAPKNGKNEPIYQGFMVCVWWFSVKVANVCYRIMDEVRWRVQVQPHVVWSYSFHAKPFWWHHCIGAAWPVRSSIIPYNMRGDAALTP